MKNIKPQFTLSETHLKTALLIMLTFFMFEMKAQVPSNFTCTSIQTDTLNSTGIINAAGVSVSTLNSTGDISTSEDLNVTGNINLQGDLYMTPTSTANLGALNAFGATIFNGLMRVPQLTNGTGYQPVFVGPTGELVTANGPSGPLFQSTSCNPVNPPWQIGGNTLIGSGMTDPSVGTCDNVQFGIKVNNLNRMYFANTNLNYNIGFGTTSPSQKYHFSGGNLLIDGNNDANGNNIRMKIVGALDNQGLVIETNHSGNFNYNTILRVNQSNTKAIALINTLSNTENVVIMGDGRAYFGSKRIQSHPLEFGLSISWQISM